MHRKFLDNPISKNPELTAFFVYCLLKASHRKFTAVVGHQEIELKPGQFIFGRKKAAEDTGLTERKVRRIIDSMRKREILTIKTTNKFSIVTICNWDTYQLDEIENRPANRPTKGQQGATYKNDKNKSLVVNDEFQDGLKNRCTLFYQSLEPFLDIYHRQTIRDFFDYWSEPNRSKTKMRFELEKTWDVKRRLNTWARREKVRNERRGLVVSDNQPTDIKKLVVAFEQTVLFYSSLSDAIKTIPEKDRPRLIDHYKSEKGWTEKDFSRSPADLFTT